MENENQEIEAEETESEESTGTMKQWMQDNLRIIVSIIIVVAIAGGIYSYSKRTEAPVKEEISQESVVKDEKAKDSSTKETVTTPAKTPAVAVPQSQETETAFVETATKGNGSTHLARKALADYLEKNPDAALTAEHKIYIEDYLRKAVGKKGVKVGTSVEFSKDLIQNAITKSKTLNDRQLQNLHKYAVRVPSLK